MRLASPTGLAEEQPSVERHILLARLVCLAAWVSSLVVFLAAWKSGTAFWHLMFLATYLLMAPLVWVMSAIPRKRQRLLDEQWARRFREMAIRDDLTGVYNRRHFSHELERLIETSTYDGSPLTLALIDLNDFKTVNDTFGHAAGDDVLQRVAGRIVESVGDRGVVARIGGDEFAVILPSFTPGEAQDLLASLCGAIRDVPTGIAESAMPGPPIRAAVGVASLEDASDAEILLRVADGRLYEHKRDLGRPSRQPRVA